MKDEGKWTVRWPAVIVTAICLLIPSTSSSQSATKPNLRDALSSLEFFIGDWECSGKFDSSGKTIEAHQHFSSDQGGAWILFRHDDKPPHDYHALSEWGWDTTRKQYLMTAQDSFAGARVFYSNGWESTRLQWDGDAVGSNEPSGQRFSFERLDDRHFKVDYFTRKGDDWSRVDSITCSKQ